MPLGRIYTGGSTAKIARPVVHGFDLASMNDNHHREFKLKQLDSAASSGLETRSQAYTSLFKREHKERLSQSANAIPSARSLGSGL